MPRTQSKTDDLAIARSADFGRDVIDNLAGDRFAMVIYNKKCSGVIAEGKLIVLSETGERVSSKRNGMNLA
jgi:hypothetical protein